MNIKNKKSLIVVLSVISVITISTILIDRIKKTPEKHLYQEDKEPPDGQQKVIPLPEFDSQLFDLAIQKYPKAVEKINSKGGIAPHHFLAADLIAEFYSQFDPKTKTVVLVGPNHDELGDFDISLSDRAFDSSLGIVKNRYEMIKELEKNNLGGINNKAFLNEHAVLSHIPFIKHYLPKAKIVPIILKKGTPPNKIEKLSEFLKSELNNNNTILISSVDFSHYLPPDISNHKDNESLEAIKSRDYSQLMNFNNGNLDSPASVILLLKTMDKINYSIIKNIKHTNSAELLNNPKTENTSYYTLLFLRKESS